MHLALSPDAKRRTASAKAILRYLVHVTALAAVYSIFGKVGLFIVREGSEISLLWPPSGIALAALILYGYRLWPGIVLGKILIAWFLLPEHSVGATHLISAV